LYVHFVLSLSARAWEAPAQGGTAPSTGLVGVYLLLQLCNSVSVYGFGWHKTRAWELDDNDAEQQSSYHYYKFWGRRAQGNTRAHAFDVVRVRFQALPDTFLAPRFPMIGGRACAPP